MCTDSWLDTAEKKDTRQKKVIGYRFQLYFSHILFQGKIFQIFLFQEKILKNFH